MTDNVAIGICRRICIQEFVANTLVIALEVIVSDVFLDCVPQLGFAKENHAV